MVVVVVVVVLRAATGWCGVVCNRTSCAVWTN